MPSSSETLPGSDPSPPATLRDLSSGALPVPAGLAGHWHDTLPGRVAGCARALERAGSPPAAEAAAFMVPGRHEVLGKHTDYAGGRSLLAAVERGFIFVVVPRPDAGRVRMLALDPGEEVEFPLDPRLEPTAGWRNYAMTVARRAARDFPGLRGGADIALSSDLPPASGMSSSSAFLIGTFLCIAHAAGLGGDPRFLAAVRDGDDLASYLAAMESGAGFGPFPGDAGVGTHGGSEDHTAILRARGGELLQYRFVPPVLERSIAMPAGYTFAIASSGIQAEKTGAMRDRYNLAAARVRELREILAREEGRDIPSLGAALRDSPAAAARLRAAAGSGDLLRRLEHFLRESEEILPAAADALAAGDIAGFGARVDESQRLAESHLENQIPPTIELARAARRLGAAAASAFGAGYGGSVWALVESPHATEFLDAWRAAYTHPEASFFLTGAGSRARRVG